MRAPVETGLRARKLRRTMTLPERYLWALLRRKTLEGLRFRRQHPLGTYVLDFYCPSARLCVEVDGPAHEAADRIPRDAARDRWLAQQGIRTLRVSAEAVLRPEAQTGILEAIVAAAAPSPALRRSPSPALRAGEDRKETS